MTESNYYDTETDKVYQSPTFFKKFIACEAETMAEINGTWKPDFHEALLMGNYLHSYFESPEAHQKFIDENKWEIFGKKRATKADKAAGLDVNGQVLTNKMLSAYTQADEMIQTLDTDENFKDLYQGTKETIVTGQIGDVPWKGKIDCLNLDKGYFIDLKTTQDIHKRYWNSKDREWESFIAHWNYQLQMYVYQQLIYQTFGVMCEPYIVAVSKEKVPGKAIVSISEYRMVEAENQLYELQDHFEAVKKGLVEPKRCGFCDYCKSTAKLSNIVDMDDLVS